MSDRDPLNIVGQVVADKYQIEKLVGEGGFAVVYRANHTIWKKPVAIKFFNGLANAPIDQREELQQQFINEGALLTDLSSQTASIVQARDVGSYTTPDGQWMPYMVLEWLEGRPLDDVLEKERAAGMPRWSLANVVALLAPAAAALDIAHGKGIAHRDIKPANLFVLGDNPRGAGASIKVLDFGVAKMMTDNTQLKAALAKTGTGITSFTPGYGAPEQFSRSYGATGPWTDVFAFALVAVEMLASRAPLDGEDLVQLAFSSGNPQQRPTPRAYGVDVSDSVEAVFQKALHVDPKHRYARCAEFWAALEAATGGRLAVSATVIAPQTGGVLANQATMMQTVPAQTLGAMASTTNPMMTTGPQAAGAGAKGGAGLIVGIGIGLCLVGGGAIFMMRGKGDAPAAPTAATAASVAAPASASAAPRLLSCPDDMLLIKAGQYFMGSDAADAKEQEKPSHSVKLSTYCIDKDEVTSGKYKTCSDEGKCKKAPTEVDFPGLRDDREKKAFSTLCTGNDAARAEHPINCVDWSMAKTFCESNDRRLPTEAEWEYATRGPDGRVYPWGDEAPTAKHLNACGKECVAWASKNGEAMEALYDADDGFPATAPVGSYPLGNSRFGPRDVVGNVWEWVSDWEGKYTADAQTDPTGSATGEKRVIRGGAFNGWFKAWLRPSFRFAQVPTARVHAIGFRCAKGL